MSTMPCGGGVDDDGTAEKKESSDQTSVRRKERRMWGSVWQREAIVGGRVRITRRLVDVVVVVVPGVGFGGERV